MTLSHLSLQHVPHRQQPVAWTNEERLREFRGTTQLVNANGYPWAFRNVHPNPGASRGRNKTA